MSARDETDDTFELYDLRVEVVATDRPMVCGHRAGDWLELRGENLTLPAGQLPAAFQQARDRVAGRELNAGNLHVQAGGSGTAVTSRWRNARVPMRAMRNLAPQLGSGQAISVSVVIQSCAWVTRCFAGRSGSSAASA